MRRRGAEERHDAVTDVLVDMAAVGLNDPAEAVEAIIHQGMNGFRIQPLGQ